MAIDDNSTLIAHCNFALSFNLRHLGFNGLSTSTSSVIITSSKMLNFKVLFSFSDFDYSPMAAFNASLPAFANDKSIFRDEFHDVWFFCQYVNILLTKKIACCCTGP
ncbi:unnamed protein product [Clavelina lepadiformis]|uniref:Uncharacterized protein n=1 Tax=Clavelina lepadiformis TaxID=159417 RepID=A0ABP0FZM4_CLALP